MSQPQVDAEQTIQQDLSFFSPFFIGAHGENSDVLEELLVEFVRDHVYWRRNFHPEDIRPISPQMTHSSDYQDAIARLREELLSLTSNLKRTVPIYSPRYLGHMASDLMLPALLAQLVTTIYNPNNSFNEVGETTINMELEVGNQFAKLFGFNTDPQRYPCAWGHLTSGGTDANYESLWNFRAVKYYPVALVESLRKADLSIEINDQKLKSPNDYTPWELVNFSIEEVLEFRRLIFQSIKQRYGDITFKRFSQLVEDNRLEALGPAQFFAQNYRYHQPVVLVPATAYPFWQKAMRLLGLGSASLVEIPLTGTMRMDENELERILEKLRTQNIPVLAVVGVLGTLDFGTIDPIHKIVEIRDKLALEGLSFYIHIDASCGAYVNSLFTDQEGNKVSRDQVANQLKYFPSESVYDAFTALSEVDSITVSPHSFGYLPQGIGGFIARNRDVVRLLNSSQQDPLINSKDLDMLSLSRYILDGTKPGANAASAYITHKVLPLNHEYFGRIIKQTIAAAEYLYDKLSHLKKELKDVAILDVPFEPDTNLIVVSINPNGNVLLDKMNLFMEKLVEKLSHNPLHSVQTNEFLSSCSHLALQNLTEVERLGLFKKFSLDDQDALYNPEQKLHLLRHTLMNPWISSNNNGTNYLDDYCRYLKSAITDTLAQI
ncbi:pyridoxal phosphate-dependent decarboxylase family protein [Aliikangiella marina]|nr:pyridoxal-dependent decarboxylase [Aliikangiella marina]